MKKLLASLFVVSALTALVLSCQKENSFESGAGESDGLLQSDVSGDCLPKQVVGTYIEGTALNGTNDYIQVSVDVTTTGTYTIYSDTLNGVFFRSTGVFTTLGMQTINLRGNGVPAADGPFNFTITYGDQVCNVLVEFLPSTAGGPAVFTIDQTGGNCSATPNGTYSNGVALVAGNTVTLNVTVATIGTYSAISTTFQGMTFSAPAGTFTTTGAHTITLQGSGTPTTGGANVVPVTAGSTTCSFTINVGAAATGTLGGAGGACTPSTINGTYTAGVALTGTNTVAVSVNFTTTGNYTISTNTVNGYSFSATGTAAATGPATITLQGTGTPTAAGTNSFTVTFGTSTCTFNVTVIALVIDYFPRTANSNWSYEIDDDADDSLRRRVIAPTHSAVGNTFNIFQWYNDLTSGWDSGGYYRKQNTDYFEWVDMGGFIGFNESFWREYIFLKDAAQGTNWKSAAFAGTVEIDPGPPPVNAPLTVRFSYTIESKDIAVNFNTSTGAQSFNNVIVVKEEFEAEQAPNVWINVSDQIGFSKSYYARGIGLIKFELYDEFGDLSAQFELRRWQVF